MLEIDASQLARFMACNGSRLLGGHLPPSDNDPTARNEGTAAHWVINESFHRRCNPDSFLNQRAPNGVIITAAILRSVSDFHAHIVNHNGVEEWCSWGAVNARCDAWKR